jgi:hypothetical protein
MSRERSLLYGLGLGLALVVTPFLQACQTGQVTTRSSTSPALAYVPDANDRCMEQHVWDTTGPSGWGTQVNTCSAVPWFNERRRLDAKAGAK